ncbi:MAG TPA: hypothetical protein VN657_09085 [Nitrospiraceae bacterium]|jgi:hypothetical protein|nr:hypothetical protein [Nitrospiraceae bacterium]
MTQPILQAILLCQDVKEDLPGFPGTSLFGISSLLRIEPGELHRFVNLWVYARVVNVEGLCDFAITFANTENESVIQRFSAEPINIDDPRSPIEITQLMSSLSINGPGRYECRLYANSEFLGHTTLYVVEGSASP